MNEFSIRVFRGDTRTAVIVPSTLTVKPMVWTAQAKGGMWSAEVMIYGLEAELSQLTAWLGYEIQIVNGRGTPVWWGDIFQVDVLTDGIRKGVSLDKLANRVMLRYTENMPGNAVRSVDTDWIDDLTSQSKWGVFEKRISPKKSIDADEATAARATALFTYAEPPRYLEPDGGEDSCRLVCRGYIRRGNRTYYKNLAGLIEHIASGESYPLGQGIVASQLVAFAGRSGAIWRHTGLFQHFKDGTRIKVTGASDTDNNDTFTITGIIDKDPASYSATTISFAPNDDLIDTAGGLGFIENDDVFRVTGSAGNSGTHIMDKAGAVNTEVGTGMIGHTLVSEAAGPSVTIQRGNGIEITPSPVNEQSGSAVTVTVWGQRYYQPFTMASNTGTWTIGAVELRMARFGSPTDVVTVSLYTDNAGAPNTYLGGGQLDPEDFPREDAEWVTFDFGHSINLSYGVTYGLVIQRVGANSPDSYYTVDLDEASGYGGGSLRMYDGAAYNPAYPVSSLIFRVIGVLETNVQMQWVLNGQGWVDSFEAPSTGVYTAHYRDGELTSWSEFESLLDVGTSAGLRLVALTDPLPGVRVFVKPDKSTARWTWQKNTRLTDLYGQDAEPGYLPVAEWVHLGNKATLGTWASLSPVFIERAEYSPSGGWRLEAESQRDMFDVDTEQG